MRRLRTILTFLAVASVWPAIARADAPLPQIAAAAKVPYVAVLVWHDVVTPKEVWFDTEVATFRTQLEAIRSGGFSVVSLDMLRDHLQRGAPLPKKPLVLTFDDNGHGLYENALPLLVKYKFPATLFVHSNFVGKTTTKRHNTWPQLQAMVRTGLISVQSLTANHPPDLRPLPATTVLHEFTLSKFSLEHRLGKPVYALVYPEDNYDERLARLAARSGYVLGFTEDWGNAGDSSSMLLLHRYSILTRFDQALRDVATAAR
ncbi:MAG: polysaccharide deacetylase family protein [Candidatus Eremiobacteraeota bacterium]|nr:polysaccharide deacetylase family protein [Candidatus Eremiobacteraeota bacterium]